MSERVCTAGLDTSSREPTTVSIDRLCRMEADEPGAKSISVEVYTSLLIKE